MKLSDKKELVFAAGFGAWAILGLMSVLAAGIAFTMSWDDTPEKSQTETLRDFVSTIQTQYVKDCVEFNTLNNISKGRYYNLDSIKDICEAYELIDQKYEIASDGKFSVKGE